MLNTLGGEFWPRSAKRQKAARHLGKIGRLTQSGTAPLPATAWSRTLWWARFSFHPEPGPSLLSVGARQLLSAHGYWRLSADVHSVLLRYNPHASVLINPSVTKDAFSPSGFPTRRWTVLSPSLLSRPLEIYSKVSSSWRWESGKRSGPSKRSVFSTAIRLPLAAAADVDTVCRWTTRPRRVVLGSSAYTQRHLRARNEPRPLMFS